MRCRRCLLFALLCSCLLTGCAADEAAFSLSLRDGLSGAPLNGAAVVIPETNKTYRPDAGGTVGPIRVPVRADSRWQSRLPQPFGEVTLLIYCPGYYPLALFHFMLEPGRDRGCIPLYLFPDDGSLAEPYTLAEGPDPGWVSALLHRYQPED